MPFKRSSFFFVLFTCLLFSFAGCESEEGPTSPMEPSSSEPTPPEPSQSTAFLRVAQLTQDARTVDVLVDGEVVVRGLGYREVAGYRELNEGAHRVQVFRAGERDIARVETTVTLSGGESLTVAVVGNDPVDLVIVNDERATSAGDARVRLFNAVPDFPAPFDLGVINGPPVISGVVFGQASSYTVVVPGNYALELKRGGTDERLAMIIEVLPSSTSTTVFAVGSLARGDIELIAARDAG